MPHLPSHDALLGVSLLASPDLPNRAEVRVDDPPQLIGSGTWAACERLRLDWLTEQHQPRFHAALPTLGGKQFWAGIFVHCGWRIQEHVNLGVFRLLDPNDRKRCLGTWAQCRTAYERIRLNQGLRPASRHAVIILHGLIRAKESMRGLRQAFQDAGFEAIDVNYPSTRRSLVDHAVQLNTLLNNLRDTDIVSFVTHSMGGMVARTTLASPGPQPWHQQLRVQRMVMIFPPSRGALKANRWVTNPLVRFVFGPALPELTPSEAHAVPKPTCPFAIIAGLRDTTVLVEEARMEGAEEFITLDVEHTFGMNDPQVVQAAINYIQQGSFLHPDISPLHSLGEEP